MIDTDVASLRKIAEEATPGPWKLSEVNNYTGVESADRRLFIEAFREANGWPSEDLEHIAAFNPQVALELLDRLESAEAAIERVRAKHQPDWSDWGIDHPEEGASCSCGANYSYDECPTRRALDTGKEKRR